MRCGWLRFSFQFSFLFSFLVLVLVLVLFLFLFSGSVPNVLAVFRNVKGEVGVRVNFLPRRTGALENVSTCPVTIKACAVGDCVNLLLVVGWHVVGASVGITAIGEHPILWGLWRFACGHDQNPNSSRM